MDDKCCKFIDNMLPSARHLLTTKALLATTDITNHRPNQEGTFEWELRPKDGVIDASCTIYTDGSMIDGPSKELGRVGFGFMAYDEDDNIVAKAFGTPPYWIDSVPGAETWALAEALRNSAPGVSI